MRQHEGLPTLLHSIQFSTLSFFMAFPRKRDNWRLSHLRYMCAPLLQVHSHSPHIHSLTPRCESLHDLVKNWDVRRLFYHFHMTGFSQWVPSSFTISWKKRMLPNSLTSLGSTPNMIVTHSWGNTQLRDRCSLLAILCIHSSSRGFVFTSEKTVNLKALPASPWVPPATPTTRRGHSSTKDRRTSSPVLKVS